MNRALWLGIAGAAMSAGGLAWNLHGALAAYLCAWLFLLGLALGALELWMLHTLAGGRWFVLVRPSLSASMRSIWLVAGLFVPILVWGFGTGGLWPAPDAKAPAGFLTAPALIERSVAYLLIWIALAAACHFFRVRRGRVPQGFAAIVLVVYLFSITAAAFDWIAALEPGWYSSGLGLILASAQALGAMALAIGSAASKRRDSDRKSRRDRLNDLGNLLLMLVMFWAYLEFVQLLIVWSENLPREIAWYLPRWNTSWLWIGVALALFQFAVPMAALLARAAKRSGRALGRLALAVLAANFIEAVWLVLPTLRPAGIDVSIADVLAAGGVIAVWFAFWWRGVQRMEARHA